MPLPSCNSFTTAAPISDERSRKLFASIALTGTVTVMLCVVVEACGDGTGGGIADASEKLSCSPMPGTLVYCVFTPCVNGLRTSAPCDTSKS